LQLLLDRGAFLEDSDVHRATLLRIAITGNHVEGARILLKGGISRLDAGLLAIAAGKSEEMVELFLSQGADLNSKGYDFPILNAIRSGVEKVVAMLMRAGIDISLQEEALLLAAGEGRLSVVVAVVEHGMPHLVHNFGHSAMLEALRKGNVEAVKYFLERGCSRASDMAREMLQVYS
jgi:ankyrin repeat protein